MISKIKCLLSLAVIKNLNRLLIRTVFHFQIFRVCMAYKFKDRIVINHQPLPTLAHTNTSKAQRTAFFQSTWTSKIRLRLNSQFSNLNQVRKWTLYNIKKWYKTKSAKSKDSKDRQPQTCLSRINWRQWEDQVNSLLLKLGLTSINRLTGRTNWKEMSLLGKTKHCCNQIIQGNLVFSQARSS